MHRIWEGMNMKAVIYDSPGVFQIVDKPVPEITDPDDLLIKIEAAGICGSDVHILADPPGIQAVPGTTIGHEMVGRIVKKGSGAIGFSEGDRVVVDNNVPCGHCYFCRTGHPNMCTNMKTIGVDADGAFAEYALVPARTSVKIPQDLDSETAVLTEPLNCVMSAVNKIRLLPGETVFIAGAGPIGLFFLKLLKLNGAGKIIVSEPSAYRAKFARLCGADCVIDPQSADFNSVIAEETGGIGADVAVDAVGVLINDCIRAVRKSGRVMLFGNNAAARETICQADIARKELVLMGSYIGSFTMPETVKLLGSGRAEFTDLITHRICLEQFGAGLEAMRQGRAIKVVIKPDSDKRD